MVQSLNTKVDLVIDATSFTGVSDYGKIMIGDKGFEFYNSRDPRKYIQIPWEAIVEVRVQMFFKGKYVRGFFIETNEEQLLEFIVSDTKETLRKMQPHLKREQFVQNPNNIFEMFKRK